MSSVFKQGLVISQESTPVVINNTKFNDKFQPPKINIDESTSRIIRSVDEVNDTSIGHNDNNNSNNDNSNDDNIRNNNENNSDKYKSIAENILAEAKKGAEQILSTAIEEANGLLNRAREEGFAKGVEEGRADATKRSDEYLAKITKEHNDLISNNQREQEEFLKTIEPAVVDIVCSIFSQITDVFIDDYKDVIFHMVNNALKDNDSSKEYIIKVSESVYPHILENQDKIYGAINPSIKIELFSDVKLLDSQCIIETDNGIIDLSLDVQIDNLCKAMRLLSTIQND